MADFSNVVITERGKSLLAKVEAEKDILMFTTIKTSNTVYTKESLYNLIDINNPKQIRNINSVIYENPNQIKITCNLSNEDVVGVGYNLASYGIYAKSKKYTEEILLAAASVDSIDKTDWISPSGSLNAITINLNTILVISNIEIEKVVISDGGVSVETFNEHINAKGVNAVHGATNEPEAGAIISRAQDGSAEIEYPTRPTNKSIINKGIMDTEIGQTKSELNANITNIKNKLENDIANVKMKQGVIVNYYDNTATYEQGEVVAIKYTE